MIANKSRYQAEMSQDAVGAAVEMTGAGVSATELGIVNTPIDVLERQFAAVGARFVIAGVTGPDDELVARLQALLVWLGEDRELIDYALRRAEARRDAALGEEP